MDTYTSLLALKKTHLLNVFIDMCDYHRKIKERYFEICLGSDEDGDETFSSLIEVELFDIEALRNIEVTSEAFIALFKMYFIDTDDGDDEDEDEDKMLRIHAFIRELENRYEKEVKAVRWACQSVVPSMERFFNAFKAELVEFVNDDPSKRCDFCDSATLSSPINALSCGHRAHAVCALKIFVEKDFYCVRCDKTIKL